MKQKYMLMTVLVISFLTCLGSVTEQQALQAVMNSIPAARKSTSQFYIGEPNSSQWMIFEDQMPDADWEHEATIHLVQKNSSVNNPIINSSVTYQIPDIHLWKIGDPSQTPAFAAEQYITDITVPKRNIPAESKQYAIIISGGVNRSNNHPRYWNNCSYMYRVLRNHFNVPASNIFVAFSNGNTDEPDMANDYRSSRDLDGDGISDIYCPATTAAVKSLFAKMATILRPDDHLFIFVTDHGSAAKDSRGTAICMWGAQQYLYASEFRSLLDNINCASKNIVMAQCYSGGFVDKMKGAQNTVIASSCRGDEQNWSTLYYAPFLKHWIDALWSDIPNADTNGDGITSMSEAFTYTSINFPKDLKLHSQYPQFFTSHENLSNNLSFDYLPDPYNLTIGDNLQDKGSINLNTKSWYSPEIATRGINSDSSLEQTNPIWLSSTKRKNFVNVRVKNMGWRTYQPSESNPMYVEVYWGVGTPISMLADYKGTNTIESGYPAGGKIGSVKLTDSLEPDEEIVVSIPWLYENRPLFPNNNILNMLAIVGAKDLLKTYQNSDLYINRYPNFAERHAVRMASNANTSPINIKTPSSAPAKVSFHVNADNKGYKYYIISEDIFGDTDIHYFNSDLTIENVRIIRNTNYTATFGYTFTDLNISSSMSLEIIDPTTKECLGRYTFEKSASPSIEPPIILSQNQLDSSSIQLIAHAEDGQNWEMIWLNNVAEVVAVGDIYEGPSSTINGGKLIASYEGESTEIPIVLEHTIPSFDIFDSSHNVIIQSDINVPADTHIEIVSSGEVPFREIIEWPIDQRSYTIDLSKAKGLTIISVFIGQDRIVLGKRLL